MKKLIPLLFFVLSINLPAQDYRIIHPEIRETHAKNNYHIDVRYPQIRKFKNKTTEKEFNLRVYTLIQEQIDAFKKDMEEWESATPQYGSEFEINDTVIYKSASLISVLLHGYYYYSSAAHPNTFFISFNYDLKNNKNILFSDMFKDDYISQVSNYCIKALGEKMGTATENGWINEGAGPKEDNFKVFNITPTSLQITFPAYQVASYADGPQEVDIPYSMISDIIRADGPLGAFTGK